MSPKKTKSLIEFGVQLRSIRLSKGVSIKELAEMLDVSQASISKYECGMHPPSGQRAVAMVKLLPEIAPYMPASVLRNIARNAPELDLADLFKNKSHPALDDQQSPKPPKPQFSQGTDLGASYAVRDGDGHWRTFATQDEAGRALVVCPEGTLWRRADAVVRIEFVDRKS